MKKEENKEKSVSVWDELKPVLKSLNFWQFTIYFCILSTRIKAIQGMSYNESSVMTHIIY